MLNKEIGLAFKALLKWIRIYRNIAEEDLADETLVSIGDEILYETGLDTKAVVEDLVNKAEEELQQLRTLKNELYSVITPDGYCLFPDNSVRSFMDFDGVVIFGKEVNAVPKGARYVMRKSLSVANNLYPEMPLETAETILRAFIREKKGPAKVFDVTFAVTGHASITVEAKDKEEAIAKARELITEIDCGELYDIDSDVTDAEEVEENLC